MFELHLPNLCSEPKAAIPKRPANAACGVGIFSKLKG